jgi:hypothetical protein
MAKNPVPTIFLSVASLSLAFAFVAGIACGDLSGALDGEECFSDADCGPLACVSPNPNGLNPAGLGWCLDTSICVVGEQPYCPCGLDPASSEPLCGPIPDSYSRVVSGTIACWDGVNAGTCLCLPSGVTCQYGD